MPGVDVKRLAAIDVHGARGTALRRRVVLAEFALALAVAVALGLQLWLFVPLSLIAMTLRRPRGPRLNN
jgi:hypothetical protein